jgi:ubiquinone/menaquinone biosynthesis C-methylase UbiE
MSRFEALRLGGPKSMSVSINERFYPERGAGGFSRLDGTVAFYQRVAAVIEPTWTVADFGAGRGVGHIEDNCRYRRELRSLRSKAGKVIGLDVDEIVLTNPSLHEAHVIVPGRPLPLEDNSVDAIVSDFTFEHVENPEQVVAELDRILKPGGWLFARTPNRRGYIALAARLIPTSLKMRVLSFSQPRRKVEDVFPAYYRMNTFSALKRLFPVGRYEHFSYAWDSEPAYSADSILIYAVMRTVSYLTPPSLRSMLLISLRKKSGGSQS